MRLLLGRASRQHPRQQPRHRIHQHHRRQLAARQHEIAQRDFIGHQMLAHPLVHALIVPADQRNARLSGQFARDLLVKTRPCGLSRMIGPPDCR